MKIPAIRGHIGNWSYYISSLSFEQISKNIKKVDEELHKSEKLSDLIQRSISNNYKEIAKYILTQEERFFNSLVLAVYDGDPQWIEVEHRFEDADFFNMGFLTFNGQEKIFPVDGQHRVEGIKKALEENKEIGLDSIPVIFIGHELSEGGMQRSRRLFTTLNRYAKPVTLDDIIALDEDDTAAIITRKHLEEFLLFESEKIIIAKQKAIPANNYRVFTSIITLYQCNVELIKYYHLLKKEEFNISKKYKDFAKFRPEETILEFFQDKCDEFWNLFVEKIDVIRNYIADESENPAREYRNNENGGHILFRPVGLIPFIKAIIKIHKKTDISIENILVSFNDINMRMNSQPWQKVVWNPIKSSMVMGNQNLTRDLFIYIFDTQNDANILSHEEIRKIKEKYSQAVEFQGNIEDLTII
jgi:DNA sulfur modification protein DndB